MKLTAIMILNDGKTFTDLEGCQIRIVDEDLLYDYIDAGEGQQALGILVKQFTSEDASQYINESEGVLKK